MGKNQGPIKSGQPGKMGVKQIVPQVLVTVNPSTGQLHVNANFKDWDQVENMLIDALRAAYNQRIKESESPIAVPEQRIILPGS